uniref:Enoyl-CoA hydratase domain-containing protein 3, mitochondrial n=1 Tax=Candidatus Kentrum sp. MB TaxID=2138164 RepID=A0A450XD40_9GAMM|nr:MAG: Enoyl-CoA hydratase [Candidatus Kentron sp. MB]VFK31042.1 MAG: Enoyl-CoA hydratase [Candidatus Kentron sp. MB]VFK75495.1 MAG: Enoyl-CoA hydratase [Candidatus Kentron sp. MB]
MTNTSGSPSFDEPILLSHSDQGVATLTLNRPWQYNALSEALLSALQQSLDDIANDRDIRVVVISANGPAFCAGHDLKEMRANPERPYYEQLFQRCSRMMMGITQLPQPVIARVHGLATAAGCQLVAACDLAIAATSARFAVSGINLGLFCSGPAVALTRNILRKHAFETLVTGDFIDADKALAYGLINHAVPQEDLDEAVDGLTRSILRKPASAVELGKRMFYQQFAHDQKAAYAYASRVMADNMMLDDAQKGIDSFLNKGKQP